MTSVVLDATALIALIHNEPGADAVKVRLPGALISTVNLCEVFYKSIEKGHSLDATQWAVNSLPVARVPFDDEQAAIAAAVREATRGRGISLADQACLALGLSRKLPVYTSDGKWASLAIGVQVVQFR